MVIFLKVCICFHPIHYILSMQLRSGEGEQEGVFNQFVPIFIYQSSSSTDQKLVNRHRNRDIIHEKLLESYRSSDEVKCLLLILRVSMTQTVQCVDHTDTSAVYKTEVVDSTIDKDNWRGGTCTYNISSYVSSRIIKQLHVYQTHLTRFSILGHTGLKKVNTKKGYKAVYKKK